MKVPQIIRFLNPNHQSNIYFKEHGPIQLGPLENASLFKSSHSELAGNLVKYLPKEQRTLSSTTNKKNYKNLREKKCDFVLLSVSRNLRNKILFCFDMRKSLGTD